MHALLEHRDLAADVLEALLVLPGEGDYLHRHDRAARPVARLIHGTIAPLPEQLEQLEEILRPSVLLHGPSDRSPCAGR